MQRLIFAAAISLVVSMLQATELRAETVSGSVVSFASSIGAGAVHASAPARLSTGPFWTRRALRTLGRGAARFSEHLRGG